jgi:hypothetical protein
MKSDDDIINNLKKNQHILIKYIDYQVLDLFLIEQVIKHYSYDIYIDEDFLEISKIINICNLNNITYKIKNKLNITCLLSGQRTGSTLLIDILQKSSKNTLALSEIFNYYDEKETYTISYDCSNEFGILHGLKIFPFTGQNMDSYFKQFEDYAIFHDKELFIFKLTIDFNQELDFFKNINDILDFIVNSNNNIIYFYDPVPQEEYSSPIFKENQTMVDDYRNPVCAAIALAHKYRLGNIYLASCSSAYTESRFGTNEIEDGLHQYPQQKLGDDIIDANLFWYKFSNKYSKIYHTGIENSYQFSTYLQTDDFIKALI